MDEGDEAATCVYGAVLTKDGEIRKGWRFGYGMELGFLDCGDVDFVGGKEMVDLFGGVGDAVGIYLEDVQGWC